MGYLLIIIGPTATGKTKLAVWLAKKFNGEIISADSRQVYRGLDIITGKDKSAYGEIPVWGLDLVDPKYSFNVSDFVKFASEKITEIQSRGKLPIIVGGTVLYIKSLLHPPETLHIPQNPKLRKELEKLSVKQLQERLGKKILNESDFKNPRRLIRAIEVADSKPFPIDRPNLNYQIINLTGPADWINGKIGERVDDRLKLGAAEEAKRFPNSTALGVKEIQDPNLWKLHERQYAKRQITFIKKFLNEEKALGTKVIELDARNEAQKNSFSL